MEEVLDLKGAIILNLPSYLLMMVRIKAELFNGLSGPTFLIIVYWASSGYLFLAKKKKLDTIYHLGVLSLGLTHSHC